MIATPGEPNLLVPVPESFHEQTNEELIENDLRRMDADDQAIQTILLGLPEDVYAAIDSCDTAKEIWEHINDPTKAINTAFIPFAKALQLTAPTKNNQRTSSNPRNCQIAQPVMNMSQDRQNQNVRGNGGNQFGQYARQVAQNQQGLAVVPGIANQSGSRNVVAARAEGTGNGNQARLSFSLLKRKKQGFNFKLKNLTSWLLQEEHYTDILDPILEPQLVPQNDNHVTSVVPSMVQSGGTVKISFALNEETRAHQETVYCNLFDQVAQCLTRKINALHLSYAKQITTLNDEISNLNKQLSKEKSSISSLMKEKKMLKHDFKIQEDKFLDKEVDLEARIKDLENIMLKRDQTVQTIHMLNPKPDSFYHPNQKIALGYPNPSYPKKAQLKQKNLYNGNLLLEEHDPPVVYDSEETL
nr:hypothetical protein [Tanacetum cinerariifolium]